MVSSMKIAMIGTKGIPAKWGGIEKYVEEIGKRLVQRNHHVTVLASNWYCCDYHQDYYKGIKIVRVPALHFQATDALSNALFSSLYCLFQPYDIIHFHNYASYIFIPFLNTIGKKTVLTTHGLVDSQWYNPKYGNFGLSVIRNFGAIGLKRVHVVTTVADIWKIRIKEEFGREAYVLPSGLDKPTPAQPEIIRKKYGLEGNDYILFLGRIDPIKRIDWLINALPEEEKFRLVIAGGTQDDQTKAYMARLHDMRTRLSSKILFTGPVAGEEKSELLANCRLFVNPSSSEGLPLSILEAMSYERCCIASDISAHKEVVSDGQTGFLFDQNDCASLRDVLTKTFKKDNIELISIGRAAKQQVADKYDWNKTTQLTEQIYRGLIDEK